MTKYIPCTHCTVQQCNNCDYKIHQKAMTMIRAHKGNLISLREHFRDSEQHEQTVIDFETVTDVLEALEIVDHGEI